MAERAEPIVCEGAPRDIGFDRGQACRRALHAACARTAWNERLKLRLGANDPYAQQVGRDLLRHFPHQAESLVGIARAAGVPAAWLRRRLADSTGGPTGVVCAGSLVVRILPVGAMLRRSRPEGGFRSVEVTLPWLTSALAGVNERGLALACTPGLRAAPRAGECAVPAALLAQGCLQQFDSTQASIDCGPSHLPTEKTRGRTREYLRRQGLWSGFDGGPRPKPRGIAGTSHSIPRCERKVSAAAD